MRNHLAAAVALVCSICASGGAGEALNIGSRRELFVDRLLVDVLRGTALKLHEPRPAEDIIRIDKPWEGEFNYGNTAFFDGRTYRIYYRGMRPDGRSVLCVALSLDGIHWVKPNLGLAEWEGSRENNIVAMVDGSPTGVAPWLNTRPGAQASERYVGMTSRGGKEMYILVSEDGFSWRYLQERPVLTTDLYNAFDSYNLLFWSEPEQMYLCYLRYSVKGETLGQDIIPGVRAIARTTSKDLKTWTEPVKMTLGDAGLKPPENLYTNATSPYFRAPHIYVAFPARFMPGRRVITDEQLAGMTMAGFGKNRYYVDCSDGAFMTSRGGNHFDRTFMGVFIRPGMGPENWGSRTNYPLQGVWPTGPAEMSLYVNRHYAQKSWHIQRCVLRTDGFASVNAPYEGGEMVTKPLIFAGSRLLLNYVTSAAGHIQVELQDARGKPLPGYELEDCGILIGDEIERAVSWKKGSDVTGLAGKAVRLRCVMKDADLFAIQFQPR